MVYFVDMHSNAPFRPICQPFWGDLALRFLRLESACKLRGLIIGKLILTDASKHSISCYAGNSFIDCKPKGISCA